MKLEVGKYYKDRGGRIVMIVKYEEDEAYPYSGDIGETYQENGRFCKSLSKALRDLIEEVIPVPAYRVKAEQTDNRDFIKSMEGEKSKVYTEFRIPSYVHEKFIDMGGWSYYATQVDAGYIDPITGEFVMNEKGSKKLRLEVGKTYKTRGGETVKIVSSDGYDNYIFRDSNKGTYTKEGLRYDWSPEHEYNLVEEVETTTKKEQPTTTKYYRTTEKNTETKMPVGSIVTLYEDDGSTCPKYKNVNTGKTRFLTTDNLEEINVKIMKTVISPTSKLVKILEDSGYEVKSDGHWFRKNVDVSFQSNMFYYCGKDPGGYYKWLPEWLEEKVVFDSTVNTFNARQFIVDFMKKKRELSHEAYLYQRDIDEIENEWSDDECEKVTNRILRQVEIDFTSSCCPFCIKFPGDCDNCSYGKRHEVCSDDDSDFGKYIHPAVYGKVWPELLDFVNNYPGARK